MASTDILELLTRLEETMVEEEWRPVVRSAACTIAVLRSVNRSMAALLSQASTVLDTMEVEFVDDTVVDELRAALAEYRDGARD